MASIPVYHAAIEPQWIDYNGHLRDAYYGLILSYAIDDVMDHLGLDAAYRARTRCTIYTLESHLHYLHEVESTDDLSVETSILGADRKRFHVGCRFTCPRLADAAATGEFMLLHVRQGEQTKSAAFPADVDAALQTLKLDSDALAAWGPGSRKIELKR